MKPRWPTDEELAAMLALPDGVVLRVVRAGALGELATWLKAWFPTVAVGAESVFLDEAWLGRHVATGGDPAKDVFVAWVEREGRRVGLMSFERRAASQTLHGRVGALAPEERAGVLGALGFPVFEALGRWLEAELLMVWVTLASRTQQVMAERRGFSLCGLVPAFDRDQLEPGRSVRVMEALYAKVLTADVRWPEASALTPKTRAVLEAMRLVPEE